MELVARVAIVVVASPPQRRTRPELDRAGKTLTLILVAPLTDFSKELIVARFGLARDWIRLQEGGSDSRRVVGG
jgi:hypothetical protein